MFAVFFHSTDDFFQDVARCMVNWIGCLGGDLMATTKRWDAQENSWPHPPNKKKHILLYIYTRLQEFIYKFDKLCYFLGAATWRYPTLGSLLVTYCANVRHALGFATHFDFAFRSLGCTIKHVITWLNYIIIIIIIIMIMIVIIMIMIVSIIIIIIIIITFIFICI